MKMEELKIIIYVIIVGSYILKTLRDQAMITIYIYLLIGSLELNLRLERL